MHNAQHHIPVDAYELVDEYSSIYSNVLCDAVGDSERFTDIGLVGDK